MRNVCRWWVPECFTGIGIFLLPVLLYAQTTVTYVASDADIINPERGFFYYSRTYSGARYTPLSLRWLQTVRRLGSAVIYRIFVLDQFKQSDISDTYLQRVAEDLERLRQAGVKVILRFAYTINDDLQPPYGDTSKDWVLRHIEQLRPILEEYYDVILVLQAGFIGVWGEWYYTDYFADPYHPDRISDQQYADRREVLMAMLDALPKERMVQVRTVYYKQRLLDAYTPLTPVEAYTGTPKARVGLYNDCFLASDTDYGTYREQYLQQEKSYLEQDSRFVAVGGETCNPNPPRSLCSTALAELARFHWTFLNREYHPDVIQGWIDGGCYEEIRRRLGYRFVLQEGTFPETQAPGTGYSFRVRLSNEGWAAPVNPRHVEVLLRNRDTGERYGALLPVDPRFWLPDSIVDLAFTVGIPEDIPEGSYDVLFYFPDPAPTLHDRVEFAIRLANEDIWEEDTGYHRLYGLHISSGGGGTPYTGSLWFTRVSHPSRAQEVYPSSSRLLGNIYPNPFYREATLVLRLPETMEIHVEIFDSLGRKVTDLIDGVLSRGVHVSQWEGGTLPSGVYFVRLGHRKGVEIYPIIYLVR